MAELRSAIFIDQLQPQTMCYLGTWIRGRLPRSGMAAAIIEVAPGLDIEPLSAATLVSRLDHQHAFLINRNKLGSMALPGESLFVLEMQPASYAILAVNEAEKAANIKVVDYRMIGATGRVYITGEESDVRAASEAATEALELVG